MDSFSPERQHRVGARRALGGFPLAPGARPHFEGHGRAPPVNRRKVSELLAMEVLERLHQLDLVAAGERRSAAEVERIRREMRKMVAVWRALLEGHRADDDGYCPRCGIAPGGADGSGGPAGCGSRPRRA